MFAQDLYVKLSINSWKKTNMKDSLIDVNLLGTWEVTAPVNKIKKTDAQMNIVFEKQKNHPIYDYKLDGVNMNKNTSYTY